MRVSSFGRLVLVVGTTMVMSAQDGVVRLPSGPPAPRPSAGPSSNEDAPGNSPSAGSNKPFAPQGLADGLAPSVNPTFKVGPEDVLDIIVWREQQLSGQVVVRPDGKIDLILGGEIEVAGKTIEQIKDLVKMKLSETMNDPLVSVKLIAIRSSKYHMMGNVPRVGAYPLAVETTVLEAIAMAGGLTDLANPKKIRIAHKDGSQHFFNYKEVSDGKKMEQNIPLRNGDMVFVN